MTTQNRGWEGRRRRTTEAQAELVVEGVVEADAATGAWVARLDWNAIRHEVARQSVAETPPQP